MDGKKAYIFQKSASLFLLDFDILFDNRNQRSIDKSKFACDYYDFLENGKNENTKYFGKYMEQYDWAKTTEKQINEMM